MLDFNPNKKKTILSLDGGGIRGTIAVAMLAELEKMTGKPCYEMFDMCAGTSTGAIIAAGIGLKLTAQEILEVYKDKIRKGFERDVFFWLRYFLGGMRHLYNLKQFMEALRPYAAGKTISDFTKPIVFITTRDVRTSNAIYVVSKGPGSQAVADWPVIGAVAASCAAPVYFPPVADNLIDGGVGVHNNPCLIATIEALEYIGEAEGFKEDNVLLMSFGNGYSPNSIADGRANHFWLADWIQYIIGEGFDEAGLQQVFITRKLYQDKLDFRRYNPLLTKDNVSRVLEIPLEGRPDPNDLKMDSSHPAQIQLMEDIGRAYARKIDWTQPNVNPWKTIGGHGKPDIDRSPVDWSKVNPR